MIISVALSWSIDHRDWIQLLSELEVATRSGLVVWFPAGLESGSTPEPREGSRRVVASVVEADTHTIFDLQISRNDEPQVQLQAVQQRSQRCTISAASKTQANPRTYCAAQISERLMQLAHVVEAGRPATSDLPARRRLAQIVFQPRSLLAALAASLRKIDNVPIA